MKKIKPTKLSLKTETIRMLDSEKLVGVAGAWPSFGCTNGAGCLPTNTAYPCATGPTQGLCMTYVQNGCATQTTGRC